MRKNLVTCVLLAGVIALAISLYELPAQSADPGPEKTTPPAVAPATGDADRQAVLEAIGRQLSADGLDPQTGGLVILDITGQPPLKAPDEPRQFPTVYTHNPDLALSTASVMKLFTTSAALHHLKPEYTFKTAFYTKGDFKDGVIDGDLIVAAGGDPFLVPERLNLLVRELKLADIRQINGKLLLDASAYDVPLHPKGWDTENFGEAYSAPVHPFSYSFNVISVHVFAGDEDGKPTRVMTTPEFPELKIINSTTTSGHRTKVMLDVKQETGKLVLTVSGTLPKGRNATYYTPAPDPAWFFGHALKAEMRRQGIVVKGKVGQSTALPPEAEPLVTTESLPLALLVRSLNQYSNNVMAELILRQLAREVGGEPATEAKGLAAVKQALVEMGLNAAALQQKDGSGLTRENQATARLTAELLARMALRADIGPEFVASLSVNGANGTLRKHLIDDGNYRRVRGKTGFINNVYGLAGYIHTKNGRLLAYCLLLNGVQRQYRDTWDNVIDPLLLELVQL